MDLAVDEGLSLRDAHEIAEEVRHAVLHGTDGVSDVTVHLDPWKEGAHRSTYHAVTAHHVPPGSRGGRRGRGGHDHSQDGRHDHPEHDAVHEPHGHHPHDHHDDDAYHAHEGRSGDEAPRHHHDHEH
jgi:hydrogenase nickel incorporation protein HypB